MSRVRAFTLLEVALIVAIIGMMLLMIIGYLFAPKDAGPLPPIAQPTPMPWAAPLAMPTPAPVAVPTPIPAPASGPTEAPAPIAPAPAPVATPAARPAQTIDLSTPSVPAFR
jgi:hypothetical protein